jgi:hypothetical protein
MKPPGPITLPSRSDTLTLPSRSNWPKPKERPRVPWWPVRHLTSRRSGIFVTA